MAEELRSLLRQEAVPYWPGKGVEFHSPLALFGAEVDHLFVLGAAEGLWPKPLVDDPALPFHLRLRLREVYGLPLESPAEAVQREHLSALALLLAAQTTLHLSYPLRLGREPLAPSPFLEDLGVEVRPPEDLPPASPMENLRANLPNLAGEDPVVRSAQEALRVEALRLRGRIPSHEGEVGAVPKGPIPIEALADLRTCPFRFWVRGVLRPRLAPDPRAEALRRLLREVRFHPMPKEAAMERLAHLPLARGHREALKRLLQVEDFLPEGSQLLLLDEPFTEIWEDIPLEGRLDHLERRPNGLWALVYQGRYGPDPILGSIFRDVLPRVLGEGVRVEWVHLYGKPKEKSGGENPINPRSFFRTDFPPDWDQKECWTCGFRALCRHGPHFSRKEGT